MKKSIKYAGIAAATLLAVAPVAAPVVSTTNTVQAAATDTASSNSDLQTSATKWLNQFSSSVSLTKAPTETLPNANYGSLSSTDGALATFIQNPLFATFLDHTNTDNGVMDNATYGAVVTKVSAVANDSSIKGSNSDGTLTADEANTLLADTNGKGLTFTITLSYTDLDGNTQTVTKNIDVTYAAQAAATTTANVNFTTPYTVAYGSSTTTPKFVSTLNLKLTDQDGTALKTTGTTLGGYFKTFAAARDDAAGGYTGSTFTTTDGSAVTYYQPVTVTYDANSNLAKLVGNLSNDGYSLDINGTSYTSAAAAGDIAKIDTTNNTITFVRQINVGTKEASSWTTEDVDGVVTTKSDSAYYTLKNDDNDTITNRALAKNTAWKTNAVRTNSNGDKQYRVATGEWIDANDVTFSDGSSSSEGAYTDEQALNGKVTLDGPSSFIYMLYNDNGEAVSNRALAGDSAWYTDKKATNADGVTVYHVATGEWVQAGSGVNYVAY